jgi:uncharacterized protein YukE
MCGLCATGLHNQVVVTEFHVDHAGLDGLADALDDAAADVGQVTWRIANKAEVDLCTEGLINGLRGGVEHTYVWGQQQPNRISDLLTEASTGVRFARKQYAETDERSARSFDAFFASPQAEEGLGGEPPPRTGALFHHTDFRGVDWYLARWNHAEDPPDFAYKYNVLTDALSVSGNVRGIVYKLFHKDIFEFFLRGISGNWDGLWGAGVEFTNCGTALAAIGRNVVAYGDDLPAVWRGNAADACRAYLLQLGRGIQARETLYHGVGNQYRQAAQLAWAQFDLSGAALGALLDKLVEIAFAIAGGTATIETVVGGIIGYGAAGWMIKQAFDLYSEATKYWTRADTIVKAAQLALASVSDVNGPGACVLPLPEAPYRFQPTKAGPFPPSYPKSQAAS